MPLFLKIWLSDASSASENRLYFYVRKYGKISEIYDMIVFAEQYHTYSDIVRPVDSGISIGLFNYQ